MVVLSKVIISALIIGFVTEIAKDIRPTGNHHRFAPSQFIKPFWMQLQGEKTAQLSQFASGVLTGIPATVCLLAILAFLLKVHVPFWLAFCVGILGWAVFLWMQRFSQYIM